jgi:hypothetical protein
MNCQSILGLRFEVKSYGVNAVPHPGFRGSIGKNMTEVRIAIGAANFSPDHAMAGIQNFRDSFFAGGLVKSGPAASGVEFGVRQKQLRAAGTAGIAALLKELIVFPREGSFRSTLSKNAVAFRAQFAKKFLFA